MLKDLSLKVKFPLYLSAVLGSMVLVLTVASYREVRRAELHAAQERLRRVSAQLASLTVQSFATRFEEVRAMARRAEAALSRDGTDGEREDALRAVLSEAAEATGVVVTELRDAEGDRILGVGDLGRVPEVYASSPPPEGGLTGLLHVQNALVYGASVPVGESADLGTAIVWRAVQVDAEGQAALLDLLGVDGRIALGSDGGPWTDLVAFVDQPPIDLRSRDGADPDEILRYETEAGPVYATVTSMSPAPWYLAVELPVEIALASAADFLVRLALLVPFALLIVAASAWLMGRSLTQSIRATTAAAEAIAAGQTAHRVLVRSGDEVGRLGLSFNTMAQRIEDSQHALEDLNESLFTMLDSAPLPIVALDCQGSVRMWNRAAAGTFGWSAGEVVGRPCPLVDDSGAPLGGEPLEGSTGAEKTCTVKGGEEIDLFVARAPTYAPDGQIDGHMLVCEDITARKRAEQQLERYAEDLARSNAELEDFAYAASHDLQEPLRMVRSFTQLLADRYSGQLDDDADRFIDFAVDGATRMESLIRGLLEYSRVDGARAGSTPSSGEEALSHALAHLGPAVADSGGVVTHDPLPAAMIDEAQLMRVFQNLIGNALKFRSDEAPRVHVSAHQDGDQTVFSVRDNGLGIPEEYFDRIFVIFKRLHGRNDFQGTGMGLAICKKIVERNEGRIWVESVPGVGSTFYFSLPRGVALVA